MRKKGVQSAFLRFIEAPVIWLRRSRGSRVYFAERRRAEAPSIVHPVLYNETISDERSDVGLKPKGFG
jgi:hypothetical protein